MKIKIYNFLKNQKGNSLKGGQEKYLDYLTNEFMKNSIKYEIIDRPKNINKYIKSIFIIDKKTQNESPTIHLLNGNKALYLEALKRRNRYSKLIYIQHSSFIDIQDGFLKMIIRIVLLKILFLRMNIIIRVSNKTLPKFLAPKKIKTIYSGVPWPEIKCDYRFLKKSKNKFKLLMVGNICKNKNQELAIKILTNSTDLTLTIVGSGQQEDYLKMKYSNYIKQQKLFFKGHQENTRNFFIESDALLILSRNEGLPLVLLEAMSYGLPVISSKAGGIEEVIKHKKNGLLLKKNNLFFLSKNIKKLIDNERLYKKISINSRNTIKEKFTQEIMFNNIYKLINSI